MSRPDAGPVSAAQFAVSSPVLRILRARGVLLRRWIREHSFVLFVLGPILVGAVLWTSEQYLLTARTVLAERLAAETSAGAPGAVGWSLALVLALVLWPGSLREAFGARPGEDLLDALAVAERSRFLVVTTTCWLRCLAPAALICGAVVASRAVPVDGLAISSATLLALSSLAFLDLAAALVLARIGWLSGGKLAIVCLGAVVAAAVPVLRPLVTPLWAPALLLHSALASAYGVATDAGDVARAAQAAALQIGACFVVAGWLSLRFRRRDMERVASIVRPRSRWATQPLPAFVERRIDDELGRAVTASLRRDLRLVLRRFSPVVPLALATALVAAALAVRMVTDGTVVAAWRAEMLVAGFVVATLAVVSIVPFLLAEQLPQLWLERSTGVTPQQVWWCKALLAAVLALPALALGVAVVLALLPVSESWRAALQLLAGGGVVAASVGASVFEIAEEPRLGLLFAAFVGLALASLFLLYPQVWFLWLVAAGWAVGEMVKRGARRVRFTDVPR